MQQIHHTHSRVFQNSNQSAMRFVPIVNLISGEIVSFSAETQSQFEDRPRFGPRSQLRLSTVAPNTPADWLCQHLVALAGTGVALNTKLPVTLKMPRASLFHNGMGTRCAASLDHTPASAGEFSLEVTLAALASAQSTPSQLLKPFADAGFHITLDATRFDGGQTLDIASDLIGAIKIDARLIDNDTSSCLLDQARQNNWAVIVEHAAWRDGEYLAGLGAHYAIRPRADA